jgi:hypothetical protein
MGWLTFPEKIDNIKVVGYYFIVAARTPQACRLVAFSLERSACS